jgi:hypothetical protein
MADSVDATSTAGEAERTLSSSEFAEIRQASREKRFWGWVSVLGGILILPLIVIFPIYGVQPEVFWNSFPSYGSSALFVWGWMLLRRARRLRKVTSDSPIHAVYGTYRARTIFELGDHIDDLRVEFYPSDMRRQVADGAEVTVEAVIGVQPVLVLHILRCKGQRKKNQNPYTPFTISPDEPPFKP